MYHGEEVAFLQGTEEAGKRDKGTPVIHTANEVLANSRTILVIVCGGSGVTMSQLETWRGELPNPAFERPGDNAGR